jgi:hypothetical protein
MADRAPAIAALNVGKHVCVQKPPTRSLAEYDRVVEAAEKASTVFKVYENFLFYPPHVLARQIVDEMMTFDHGFHCFQMGRMFVDVPVDRVHAFIDVTDVGNGLQTDMSALISWKYEGKPARFGSWNLVDSTEHREVSVAELGRGGVEQPFRHGKIGAI